MSVSTYRLPHDVRDRLAAALKPYRNHDACMTLATFLGRFWTAPRRLGLPFIIDRRALAPVEALALTEARVRGAIRTLERIGFLDRAVSGGRTHHRTPEGLRRKPVAFQFAADFRDLFSMANKRAAAARERQSRARRSSTSAPAHRPSVAFPEARPTNSPKSIEREAVRSIWARSGAKAPAPSEPNPHLEAALERWRRAAERQSGFEGCG